MDIEALNASLARLSETIEARVGGDPAESYTAKLLARGPKKCAQKVVEEAGEIAIALAAEDDDQVASEAADVVYHLLVALKSRDIDLGTVAAKLDARAGVSGLAEKAARSET